MDVAMTEEQARAKKDELMAKAYALLEADRIEATRLMNEAAEIDLLLRRGHYTDDPGCHSNDGVPRIRTI